MIRSLRLLLAFAILAMGSLAVSQPNTRLKPLRQAGDLIDPGIPSQAARPIRKHGLKHSDTARSGLSVDLVTLKTGQTVRGIIVRYGANGSLTLAVTREWLRKAHPDLFAKRTGDEASVRRAALEQLQDRVKSELAGATEDSRLSTFLRSEKKRVEKLLADAAPLEEPQFVWLDLAKKEVARITPTTAGHRRIAAWSWYDRLANVETRDARDLARQLSRKGIDPTQLLPDLSDRLPLRLQDDREWGARMALVSYALDKPLDFQGTGSILVRSDRSLKGKDAGPLIANLLGGQVDSLLKDLLSDGSPSSTTGRPPDDWLKTAYREAEGEKARAFRATRVDLNLAGRQAAVISVFAVRPGNGNWEIIWSDRNAQDGKEERAAMEATITNDPQVKAALGTLQSLGAIGDDQLRQAIRFGAATMAAQQTVDGRFFAFEGPLVQHLDGPPLWWSK